MTNSVNSNLAKSSKTVAHRHVLILLAIVFSFIWAIVALILFFMKATWAEYVGSAILFVGFFAAWVITVYVLKRKNPKFVDALLEDENNGGNGK